MTFTCEEIGNVLGQENPSFSDAGGSACNVLFREWRPAIEEFEDPTEHINGRVSY